MSSWLRTLGIDLDAPDWMARVRRAAEQPSLGSLGEYELLEEIGRGGQGIVYRARRGDRIVAIKRLLGGSTVPASLRRRFEREIEAVRTLRHAGIVSLVRVERVDAQPVLVMEWIDGRPITEWARDRSPAEIVDVALRTCEALLHAHQQGVIHRDLKPSNILVDAAGQPHILDFGLAKLTYDASAATTASGHFFGTLAYASPEHVLGEGSAVDARSDLYALGVILYEMLTGAMPYALGGSAPSAIHAVTSVEPVRPRSLVPALDRSLEAVVLETLAKRPAERYQSVDALLTDLTRYRNGEPVEAKGPTAWHTARRVVRRHPTASSIVGGLALLVLGFAVTMAALYHRSEQAMERAERARGALEATLSALPGGGTVWDDDAIVDALEQTTARLDQDLLDEPELELRLRNRLAQRYASIGRLQMAERNARRAMTLAEELGLTRRPDYGWSLHYAGLAARQRDPGEASRLLERAIDVYSAAVGGDHPLVADVIVSQAALEWQVSESHDASLALERYRRALRMYEGHAAVAPTMHARALVQLGELLWATDDREAAIERYVEATEVLESMEEPPVRILAVTHQRTADLLRISARCGESIERYRRAISLRDGEVDDLLPPCHANLGSAYFSTGAPERALESYLDAVRSRCHRLSLQLPQNRREFVRHAAALEDGLDPEEVDALWQSLRDSAPHIVSLFRYTSGRIADTLERLGDGERAGALRARIEANAERDERDGTL